MNYIETILYIYNIVSIFQSLDVCAFCSSHVYSL